MYAAAAEKFATMMLTLAPTVSITVGSTPRQCSTAVWLGRLYGYVLNSLEVPRAYGAANPLLVTLNFTRNDEPGARRRAEWMRNPVADPGYPAPIIWHTNGGDGYHPPGWHPDVRIVITAAVEASLRYNDAQFATKLRDNGYRIRDRQAPPVSSVRQLPPLPPPPPPPTTLAHPEDEGSA